MGLRLKVWTTKIAKNIGATKCPFFIICKNANLKAEIHVLIFFEVLNGIFRLWFLIDITLINVIEILLAEPNCDVNCPNGGGDSALDLAARNSGVDSALAVRDQRLFYT